MENPLLLLDQTIDAEAAHDLLGFAATSVDGKPVGTIDGVVLDASTAEVRYLILLLAPEHGGARRVLLPAGKVRFEDGDTGVALTVTAEQLAALPDCDAGTALRRGVLLRERDVRRLLHDTDRVLYPTFHAEHCPACERERTGAAPAAAEAPVLSGSLWDAETPEVEGAAARAPGVRESAFFPSYEALGARRDVRPPARVRRAGRSLYAALIRNVHVRPPSGLATRAAS